LADKIKAETNAGFNGAAMPPEESQRGLNLALEEDLSSEYLLQVPTRKLASRFHIMDMLMYGGRHEAAVGAKKPGLAPHNPPNQFDITDSHNCIP